MTQSTNGIDQAICWAILEARLKGADRSAGDVVKDLTIPHIVMGSTAAVDGGVATDTHLAEACVEQRHLSAVALFLENYALGVTPWTVTFRVAGPEAPVVEEKAPEAPAVATETAEAPVADEGLAK